MMHNEGFASRSFTGSSGITEHVITVACPGDLDLPRQLDAIARRYAEALQTLRLPPDSAVFRRVYVSDAANQFAQVRDSSLFAEPLDSPVAVSLVQQAPLPAGKVSLCAYHLESPAPIAKQQIAPGHLLVRNGGAGHLWSTRLCTGVTDCPGDAAAQTGEVFDELIGILGANGATLAGNCVRTWIYVKDVDVFYQDVVASRIAVFERQGLTRETHYIASTGIEGACEHRYDLVLMDAYSVLGLRPEQVSYLRARDRLCDTKDYNVTFERGTRVAYADRAHHFISGTASIDAAGEVVHLGDVQRQLDRALDNVDALLRSGGATLADMTHFIVYLRDPSDQPRIEAAFAERFPDVPRLLVRGAVCRPEWLVEVEGIAVVPRDAPGLPAF
ncbi:MAG TPA: Rid family hydrolase [Acidisphaera sp.]|nr:Rid family hydrolase [Acidisphaera sp.]